MDSIVITSKAKKSLLTRVGLSKTAHKQRGLYFPLCFCLISPSTKALTPVVTFTKLKSLKVFCPRRATLEAKGLSKPISRVLYPDKVRAVTIHLALMLPSRSSDQPGVRAGHPSDPLFGLAPGGVYPASQSPSRW
jgi:hypothetical protein